MSSHHVIREDQEPALIIANGESCTFSLLEQLLEWSPYVLVLDGALHRVKDLKIKFNTVLGDWDSINDPTDSLADFHPVNVVSAPNQDLTDLEKGIEYLIENNHKAISIIWASGRRLDHTLNNIISIAKYSEKATIVMFDDHSRVYCISNSFKKYFKKGTNLSLFPIGNCHQISTKGLKYNLNNEDLILPHRTGSSNETIADGLVEIQYAGGRLILMECYD